MNTNYWTSTQAPDVDFVGWFRYNIQNNEVINKGTMYKQFGSSIRCVKPKAAVN